MNTNIIDWTPILKAQEQCPRKIVQKTAKAILKKTDLAGESPKKKLSFKSTKDTNDLYTLAAYLFVFRKYDLCYEICSIYDHVEFSGDYTLWSYIRSLRCMQISILAMNGEQDKIDVILQSLKAHELPEENRTRVWHTTNKRALDFAESYQETKSSGIRYAIMGTAMIYLEFVTMGYLPEKHEQMKEWIEKIFAFLREEEK